MKINKYAPISVLTALPFLVAFILWKRSRAISSIPIQMEPLAKPKLEIPPAYLVTTKDPTHLGYSKRIYERTGFAGSREGSILVAITVVNEKAFGGTRTFQDFYDLAASLEYPAGTMNLAVYCGSQIMMEVIYAFFDVATRSERCHFNRVTVLYAPFLQSKFGRSDHRNKVQVTRRRMIARGRNFVFSNALQEEEYTLWIDADIIGFDQKDILTRFVKSGKDVIVPRVTHGKNSDYDLNSWSGIKPMPGAEQLRLMDENKWEEAAYFRPDFVPGKVYHLSHHLRDTKGLSETHEKRELNYLMPIDSVGGAILFVKSILFKQGVVFPTYNAVGTTWQRHEGYDGLETEGLCYIARTIGYSCWAMPNLVVHHYS